MERLFIFMDLEAASGNVFFCDIIEIAAQVDPRRLHYETFQSLINTKQNLSHFALQVSCISKKMLASKPYFPDVYNRFMSWIVDVTKRVSKKYKKQFHPVLVAHGGFDNDFMMLQSNLERNGMKLDRLFENNLAFADTYLLAKKLRAKGISILQDCQLSIEKLFKKLFVKADMAGQHRAMADVRFMIKIFLESPLIDCFDKEIELVSSAERKDDYQSRNTAKIQTKILNDNLPQGMARVTHNMTVKRLSRNGLTYEKLKNLFMGSVSFLDFYDKTNQFGIERKAAKAIASRLSSMGLMCEGTEEKNGYYSLNWNELRSNVEVNQGKVQMVLSDSGYYSHDAVKYNQNKCKNIDYFYEMFSNEFFSPPVEYNYKFGSFTIKEMQEIDQYITHLFNLKYRNRLITTTLHRSNKREVNNKKIEEVAPNHKLKATVDLTYEKRNLYGSKKSVHHKPLKVKPSNDYEVVQKEEWETEFSHNVEQFTIPIDRGILAKTVPIGMTINDTNGGETLPQKVPLFIHFDGNPIYQRPDGGIPNPTGKHARKNRRRQKRANLASQNPDLLYGSSQTTVKSKSGEVFILV